MLRSFAVAVLAIPLFVACSSDDEHKHHHGYGGVDHVEPECGALTTCGACTPVLGCGWCQYEDGRGRCTTGPESCGSTQPFRWNWDPETCPASSGDAGPSDAIVPAEASTEDAATEAAASEASTEAAASEVSSSETSSDDAGGDVAETTAPEASTETSTETGAPTCRIPDTASSASCTPTMGGTLCKDGQYTLGCHGGTPDPSLKCEKALSTSDGTYHCCQCGT
ncbi:MAG: hypothetical protein ACXVEF_22075 [Polyangiales bacterium]